MNRSSPAARALVALALLLGIGLVYLPKLGATDFRFEEGRRAVVAREMRTSGDPWIPTIWGSPYLNKPPGSAWSIVALSRWTGEVDELSTRLASFVPTALSALLLFLLAARRTQLRTAAFAAGLFAVLPMVSDKAVLGELEALFGLLCFAGIALLLEPERVRWWHVLASAPLLALALLTKGPPALVFFGAAGIALAVTRGPGAALRVLPAGLLASAALGLWAWHVASDPRVSSALDRWGEQLGRGNAWTTYLADRGEFVLAILAGFAPASLILLARWSRWRAPEHRATWIYLGVSTAFFALYPGAKGRYLYPLLPVVARLAAELFDVDGARPRWSRHVEILAAAAALGTGLFALAMLGIPAFGLERFSLAALPVGLALLALGVAMLRAPARLERVFPWFGVVATLGAIRLLLALEVTPQEAARTDRRRLAAELEQQLPGDDVVRIHSGADFNTLFYLRRRLEWIDRPEDARAGEWILVNGKQREEFGPVPFPRVGVATLDKGREYDLYRATPRASDAEH